MPKLQKAFYLQEDVLQISRDLLGKVLYTQIDGVNTSGIIVETEAYAGENDKASHAYGNRRTNRTEVMFYEGGVSYVYLCYGIHNLFNVITNVSDVPHAVLIRAIQPLEGVAVMQKRRNKAVVKHNLTAGPGSMSAALGITRAHNNLSLGGNQVWLADEGILLKDMKITAGPRVGVDYAGEDAKLPYRYSVTGNPWVSKAR